MKLDLEKDMFLFNYFNEDEMKIQPKNMHILKCNCMEI